MAFGDRFKKFYGKIDPFGGKIFGFDKEDRKKFQPQAQHYGGSPEAAEAYRKQFNAGIQGGAGNIAAGIERSNDAAHLADRSLAENAATSRALLNRNVSRGDTAGSGFADSLGKYNAGRDAVLGNARTLEADAAALPQTYQQTADAAFRLNQDRNMRNALATSAGRGAAGLRTALATQGQANADAINQAELTRANEFNQLQQMKQNALVQAAGIRSGVGAQDQGAAGMYSGRQQAFDANALNANAQAGGFNLNRANVQQNAAGLQGQIGLSTQGQYIGALTGMEGDQLGANQKSEDQRQVYERQQYNKKWSPVMSLFNQA